MARLLDEEKGDGNLFVGGEENRWRRIRSMKEVKDWDRMERMAGCISEEVGHAAERLGQAVEHLRENDRGRDDLNQASLMEQARIHGKMIQVGMIFFAAGAHLVGLAESAYKDKFYGKHCTMCWEFEEDSRRPPACPDCGNLMGVRGDESRDESGTF